jgi:hypothetical protein
VKSQWSMKSLVSCGNTAERLASGPAVINQIPLGWRRALLPEVAFALGALFSALPAVMALEPGAGGGGGTGSSARYSVGRDGVDDD